VVKLFRVFDYSSQWGFGRQLFSGLELRKFCLKIDI
jgi:hypothetical protein